MGGSVAAIENGFQQREIQQAAYAWQQAVERNDEIVVGVNRFQVEEQEPIDLLRINPNVEAKQLRRLADLRQRRDNDAVRRALSRITEIARGRDNLMPAIIDAVRAYATLGEISDAMREQFGQFDPPVFL
jgi:methylmalonyl-CoA mutase, N-terminal domain